VKLNLVSNASQKIFTGHGSGYVAVNGERHAGSLVVTPDAVRPDWGQGGLTGLTEADFDYFLALTPEVVLLGTGARQQFVHPRLYRALTAARIGVECMDNAAVCRTYNILVAEDRRVVAAILAD